MGQKSNLAVSLLCWQNIVGYLQKALMPGIVGYLQKAFNALYKVNLMTKGVTGKIANTPLRKDAYTT